MPKKVVSGAEPLPFLDQTSGPKPEIADVGVRLKETYDNEWRLCSQDYWYWLQFIKTDDEDCGEVKTFPTNYDSLQALDAMIQKHLRVVILKARRGLISWMGVLRRLHRAMFTGTGLPDTFDTYRSGIMTIGEIEAEYLMERAHNVWHRFPDWMKRRNPLLVDNQLIKRFEKGGILQAFPMKRHGPQTFGFTDVLFDEMAWQEAARTTWRGMIPTLGGKGQVLAVSTPNGKFNLFHDIWTNRHMRYKNICRIKIHWWGDFEVLDEGGSVIDKYVAKSVVHDQHWFDAASSGLTSSEIEQMYFHSFSVYTTEAVWPEFERQTHTVENTTVIESRPMLIGWDLGYHYPAAVFFQYNNRDQFIGHAEVQGYDVEFSQFAREVLEYGQTFYNRLRTPEIHFVPPDVVQSYHSRAKSGAMSDLQEIKSIFGKNIQHRFGAAQVGTRENEGIRLKVVRPLWKVRGDGRPSVIINSTRMPLFVEGCAGGYCYPEMRRILGGEVQSEQPAKNEASHLQDGFQMIVSGRARMMQPREEKKKKREYHRLGRRTGV